MKHALIIVDYQNDFIHPQGIIAKKIGNAKLENHQKLSAKIQKLIDKWHTERQPVIFLCADYNTDNYLGDFKKFRQKNLYGNAAKRGSWGHKLFKIKRNIKDKIIIKNYFDGFYKTALNSFLKKQNINKLYLCGANVDVCIFFTAISARNRGFKVNIINSASAGTAPGLKQIFLHQLDKISGIKII